MDPHYLREQKSETINPGPLLNIRNTFPLYLLAVLFSPFIYYKNIFAFLYAYLFAFLHFYLPSPSSSPLLFCNHHHHLSFYLLCIFHICFASLSLLQNQLELVTLQLENKALFSSYSTWDQYLLTQICATLIMCSYRPSGSNMLNTYVYSAENLATSLLNVLFIMDYVY